MIKRLHETHGNWIDLLVLDALYPNGPLLTEVDRVGYGAVITVKKETDEPAAEPRLTWHHRGSKMRRSFR